MAFSEELHQRLQKLELEQERQLREIESLKNFPYFDLNSLENKSTTHLSTLSVGQKNLPKVPPRLNRASGENASYKIRLDFGNGSPASEWSEETRGWRSKGQGSCYANVQIAKEKLHELKSRWPNYPLIMFAVD